MVLFIYTCADFNDPQAAWSYLVATLIFGLILSELILATKMRIQTSLLLAAAAHFSLSSCMVSSGRKGHGLIGYGITMYQPGCAFACRDTISSATLSCTPADEHMDMAGMESMSAKTSPECYATDDIFLETLAYCVSSHCKDVPVWELEKWWKMNVAGNKVPQPDPKWTFGETLARVTNKPTEILVGENPLNKTSLVTEEDWLANYNADTEFEALEGIHEKYGQVLDPKH